MTVSTSGMACPGSGCLECLKALLVCIDPVPVLRLVSGVAVSPSVN